MNHNVTSCLLGIWASQLMVLPAHAEAWQKGPPNGATLGVVYLLIFLFGFGIPAVFGYLLYACLKYSFQKPPSLLLIVSLVVLAWWLALFVLFIR
jgi:hypothetical protein